MNIRLVGLTVLVAALVVYGCGGGKSAGTPHVTEPDYVTVQHILIGFKGTVPGKDIERTKEEAQALAVELYERAKSGEDFDGLVEQYTDDSAPGVYGMADNGAEPDPTRQIYARKDMAPCFGDVSFSLAVGEVGLARYDPDRCKFGWHIIMRIK